MYHARVYGLIFGMVNNAEDARELSQQTWVKAWNKIQSFKQEAGFYTWIYRIASNTSLDFLRSRARHPESSLVVRDDGDEERTLDVPVDDHSRPDRQAEQEEIQRVFQEALDKLTPEHKTALILREVKGLSYKEIAKIMGIRQGTVMSRIFYARKCIQTEMEGLR